MKILRTSSYRLYQAWQKGHPAMILLVGMLFFALTLVSALWASIYWSALGAAFAVAAPFCLMFGTFAAVKGRVESVVLAFLTFIVFMTSLFSLGEYMYVILGDVVRDIPASQAHNYPKGRIFELHDAGFRCEYEGAYVSTSTDRQARPIGKSSYIVCPLVSESWTPDDPVTAWTGKVYQEDIPTSGTFVAVAPADRSGYHEAIKDAVEKHGLRTIDEAAMLRWVESPDRYRKYLERVRNGGAILLLVVFGGWIVGAGFSTAKAHARPRSHRSRNTARPGQTTSRPLRVCPHCGAQVRQDRLQKHIKKCPKR